MKARKPDGSRWFTPTTEELMDRWLAEPLLLDWLRRSVEFRAGIDSLEQQMIDVLIETFPVANVVCPGNCMSCCAPLPGDGRIFFCDACAERARREAEPAREVPYAMCVEEQCELDADCALVRGHDCPCYLTECLFRAELRSHLRAARAIPRGARVVH